MPKSPPAGTRAARRAAKAGPPRNTASLRAAIAAARLPGHPPAVTEEARGLILAWLDAAARAAPPAAFAALVRDLASGTAARAAPPAAFAALVRDLASGTAARAIGQALLARTPEPQGLDCAPGCAFCCLLPGTDGGTVTEAEARALHDALVPLRGRPDGRAWAATACPALDPDTRLCRAYGARPMICRTYVSRDVSACEAIAAGDPRPGTGTLPAQIAHVTAHALARAALAGTARAPTYGLRQTAAAALDGHDADATLKAARHPPGSLDAERRRLARGLAARP